MTPNDRASGLASLIRYELADLPSSHVVNTLSVLRIKLAELERVARNNVAVELARRISSEDTSSLKRLI
jgi:hypothetical protein